MLLNLIVGKDYNDDLSILCDKVGEPVLFGEIIGKDGFRVTDGRPPHKPESTGKIYGEFPDGREREYFPDVYNLLWLTYIPHWKGR